METEAEVWFETRSANEIKQKTGHTEKTFESVLIRTSDNIADDLLNVP